VEDAWRLTQKYGKNTYSWKDVSFYLNLKSDPEIYRDQVVKSGYAKGHIAVNYVRDVMGLFNSYKTLIEP
jgi:membrane-bound lytic murein transglycosylase F